MTAWRTSNLMEERDIQEIVTRLSVDKEVRKGYSLYLSESLYERLKIACAKLNPEKPPAPSQVIEELIRHFLDGLEQTKRL